MASLSGSVYFGASPKDSYRKIWGGNSLSLLLGVAGFAYAVLFLGFWSLGRMSAMTDKLVESRANVIPFRRTYR
jgi:hypothetical protein